MVPTTFNVKSLHKTDYKFLLNLISYKNLIILHCFFIPHIFKFDCICFKKKHEE